MTPDQVEFLRGLGGLVLPSTLVPPAIGIVVYGLSLPIFTYAFSTMRLRASTRATTIQLATIILAFLIGTTSVCANIASLALYVQAPNTLVRLHSGEIAGDTSIKHSFILNTIQGWCSSLAIIVSDAVVFWRAWTLFSQNKWVLVLPGSLFVASLGTCLGTNILASNFTTWLAWSEGQGPMVASRLNIANGWLSFLTNLSCTALVTFRLWRYKRFLRRNQVLGSLHSSVHQSLFVIVESGLVFCTIQGAGMVLQHLAQAGLIADPSYLAYPCLLQFIFSLSASYPAAVIALVQSRRATLDNRDIDTLYDRAIDHLPKSLLTPERMHDSQVTLAGDTPQLPPLIFNDMALKEAVTV